MRFFPRLASAALLGFSLAEALTTTRAARASGVQIANTTSKLGNGLTVIFHVDHSLPMVVTNIGFKVGSRFEPPKRTGFAHLFEHLMFMGTPRVPTKMYDSWMEAAGGSNNAWTSEDRTDYYDIAPKEALPLLLWLEADRMRDLGPAMNQEKLDAQRSVVRNERRQNTENRPYGTADIHLQELLYPPNHPYHHPVIGSHEDLEAAQVGDVKDFFATWYDPANASLVVAGDFDPVKTMPIVERYFGAIPSKGAPKDPGGPGFDEAVLRGERTTLTSVVRETMTDNVELPRITMAWQSPKHFAPGDAELDIAGSILGAGKASRLYKALVYDKKIAQDVSASQQSGVLGSRFTVEVTARPGGSLDALETAIDQELAKIRKEKATDEEMARAENSIEMSFVERLASVAGRATILNAYQAEVGDPNYAEKDLERYRKATSGDVLATCTRVLDPNARVVLRVVPRSEKPAPAGDKKGGAK